MAKTLIHEVVFENTTPKDLYDLYMNAEKHSMVTGGPASISEKEGDNFSAHGGYISGRNLKLVEDQLIVQSWRAQNWDANTPDTILILHFEPQGKNTLMQMVHTNIADNNYDGIDKGWFQHYWEPWKKHLAGEAITEFAKM